MNITGEVEMAEIKEMAEVRRTQTGYGVFFSKTMLREFDMRSDDYAYTNALDYAKRWNEQNARRPNPAFGAPKPAGHNPVA